MSGVFIRSKKGESSISQTNVFLVRLENRKDVRLRISSSEIEIWHKKKPIQLQKMSWNKISGFKIVKKFLIISFNDQDTLFKCKFLEKSVTNEYIEKLFSYCLKRFQRRKKHAQYATMKSHTSPMESTRRASFEETLEPKVGNVPHSEHSTFHEDSPGESSPHESFYIDNETTPHNSGDIDDIPVSSPPSEDEPEIQPEIQNNDSHVILPPSQNHSISNQQSNLHSGKFPSWIPQYSSRSVRKSLPWTFGGIPAHLAVDFLDIRLYQVEPKVAHALRNNIPVVALESTIITHGMPYPENVSTALQVEKEIEDQGAVAATIAILEGKIHIGLSHDEIETLGKMDRKLITKCSRRDISVCIAKNGYGSTTVAATSLLAYRSGIAVFCTGGVGGVHRGSEISMDVSADLGELSKTPICVVSAGIKAILDIPKTLEVLETLGVTTVAIGQKNFPAFYFPDSSSPASCQLDTPDQIAQVLWSNHHLFLNSGIIVGVPIPEQDAEQGALIQNAIKQALDSVPESMEGKDITPYLLSKVAEITKGKSLAANIALIRNNARFAAKIAVVYSKYAAPDFQYHSSRMQTVLTSSQIHSSRPIKNPDLIHHTPPLYREKS